MANVAALLDAALKEAGVPVLSVSIGRQDDRATWRLDFAGDITGAQEEAAAAILATFDPASQTVKDAETTAVVDQQTTQPVVMALIRLNESDRYAAANKGEAPSDEVLDGLVDEALVRFTPFMKRALTLGGSK